MDEGSPDVIEHNGRFYINVGRPGFNSKTNNGAGYDSKKIAQEVIEGKRSRSK
jgi:hypothetical protein